VQKFFKLCQKLHVIIFIKFDNIPEKIFHYMLKSNPHSQAIGGGNSQSKGLCESTLKHPSPEATETETEMASTQQCLQ